MEVGETWLSMNRLELEGGMIRSCVLYVYIYILFIGVVCVVYIYIYCLLVLYMQRRCVDE
jgi:hypothetical protein